MSDLIRRDDALRSLEEWYARTYKPETLQGLADILAGYSAYKDIAKTPAVDAVEVVRCSQCVNNPRIDTRTKGMVWCRKFRSEVSPGGFCSYGERNK